LPAPVRPTTPTHCPACTVKHSPFSAGGAVPPRRNLWGGVMHAVHGPITCKAYNTPTLSRHLGCLKWHNVVTYPMTTKHCSDVGMGPPRDYTQLPAPRLPHRTSASHFYHIPQHHVSHVNERPIRRHPVVISTTAAAAFCPCTAAVTSLLRITTSQKRSLQGPPLQVPLTVNTTS
jgi:hypothetical protein